MVGRLTRLMIGRQKVRCVFSRLSQMTASGLWIQGFPKVYVKLRGCRVSGKRPNVCFLKLHIGHGWPHQIYIHAA